MPKSKILNSIIVLIAAWLLAAPARAEGPDWNRLIEFRDAARPDSVEGALLSRRGMNTLRWKDYELANVIRQMGAIYSMSPGLIENAALYGPIPVYKINKKIAEAMGITHLEKVSAFSMNNAMWFNEIFDPNKWSKGLDVIVHELVHIVDVGSKISRKEEFISLVEPRIAEARSRVRRVGLELGRQSALAYRISQNVGLDNPYSMSYTQEALACYTTAILMAKNYSPPPGMEKFIRQDVLKRAASGDPSIPSFLRASQLKAQGLYDEALSSVNESIRIDPEFIQAYFLRAELFGAKENYNAAIRDLNYGLSSISEFDALSLDGRVLRGWILFKKGDLDEAMSDFDGVIAMEPYFPGKLIEAYMGRVNVWMEKNDFDAAISDLNDALELSPERADAYFLRGVSKYSKNDIEAAILDFDRAIKIFPRYADAFYYRGVCRQGKGKIDGAISDLSEAIRLKPNFAEAFFRRGLAYAAKGELGKAGRDFEMAARLGLKEY